MYVNVDNEVEEVLCEECYKSTRKWEKMGKIKTENMDNEKDFLGGLTQKEFYDRLHFNRERGGHK